MFRFAGDEFIVLKLTSDPDGLRGYMDEVNTRLQAYNQADRPYPIALSYGMGFFDSGSIDTFMKNLDEKMYAMKTRHHQEDDSNLE